MLQFGDATWCEDGVVCPASRAAGGGGAAVGKEFVFFFLEDDKGRSLGDARAGPRNTTSGVAHAATKATRHAKRRVSRVSRRRQYTQQNSSNPAAARAHSVDMRTQLARLAAAARAWEHVLLSAQNSLHH